MKLPEPKPFGKYWTICGVVALSDIIIVLLTFIGYYHLKKAPQFEYSLSAQKDKRQLKDIQTVLVNDGTATETLCPEGYEELFRYRFQGTKLFYECDNSQIYQTQQQSQTCQQHSQHDPSYFSNIPYGTLQSAKYCGLYSKEFIHIQSQCEKTQVECSNIADYQGSICANTFEECPINDIEIEQHQGPKAWEFKFSRTAPNKMPIIDFQLVEGQAMCKDSNSSAMSERKFHWIFNREIQKNPCKISHTYEQLLVIDELRFFSDNNYQWLLNLHELNLNNHFKYSAFFSHQVPWNPNYNSLLALTQQFSEYGWSQLSNLQLLLSSFNFIAGFLTIWSSVFSTKKKEDIKIMIRLAQLIIVWGLFFSEIFIYRRLFQQLEDTEKLTIPQLSGEISESHKFYKEKVDIYDTFMLSLVSLSILFAVMQKWYYTRVDMNYLNRRDLQMQNEQQGVFIRQMQTFSPFFDDDQV